LTPPLPDHLDQPTARVLVMLVRFEMLREMLDTRGQQRNLDLRGSCILIIESIFLDDGCLGCLV
jgi:hypothetical protein